MATTLPPLPATVLEIAPWFAALAATQASAIAKGLGPFGDSLIGGWFKQFNETAVKVDDKLWNDLMADTVRQGLLSSTDAAALKRVRTGQPLMDFILFIITGVQLMQNSYAAFLAPAVERMMQAGLKHARPMVPPAGSLMAAAFIAPEKTGEVRDYLARLGYSEPAIDLMFLSMYRLYDENVVRELWWRKILTDQQIYERLRELGYTDTRIKEMVAAWQLIPPVQDILTMVAHEAFEPDSIAKMGLDQEFPEEQSEWLEKQGLNRYWQMKYWISHWEQPSISMGYEMLQRGIIKREDLEFLFRTVEIPRYWREKLLAIAYMPYTRVDARRMHKLGVLTDDELIVAYRDIGYDQAHAEKMALFTKRANMAAEKDLSKADVLAGYKDRLLTKPQTKEFLIRLGYSADEADYYIARTDFDLAQETAKIQQTAVKARYLARLIDQPEARRLLDALGLPAANTAALLATWEVSLVPDDRGLSRSELDNFYKTGIISLDVYTQELRRMGYSTLYISWFEKYMTRPAPTPPAEY